MKDDLIDTLLNNDTSNMPEEIRDFLIESLSKSLYRTKKQKRVKERKKEEKTKPFYFLKVGEPFLGSSVRGTVQTFIKVTNAWARELVPSEENKEVLVKGDFKVMSPEIMVVIS